MLLWLLLLMRMKIFDDHDDLKCLVYRCIPLFVLWKNTPSSLFQSTPPLLCITTYI
jgi:hypothetical protein